MDSLFAIEFAPLTRDEAASWLMRRGSEAEPSGPLTLSELYATIRGDAPTTSTAGFGFLP